MITTFYEKDSDFGKMIVNHYEELDELEEFMIYLIFLDFEKGNFKVYIDSLPTSFDTPIYWNQNEIKELQSSPILSQIDRINEDLLKKFHKFQKIFAQESLLSGIELDLDLVKWSYSIFQSRIFRINYMDETSNQLIEAG